MYQILMTSQSLGCQTSTSLKKISITFPAMILQLEIDKRVYPLRKQQFLFTEY